MHKLLEKVEKEIDNIANKGISSSNLDATGKLVDIYKDIKESCYYEEMTDKGFGYGARQRDSRGRFMENGYDRGNYDRNDYDRNDYRDEYDRRGNGRGNYRDGVYNFYPILDEKTERYFNRMREGMENYNEGKNRYRGGDTEDRMIDGIEMTMNAICMFVECLADYAETPKEKEVIRKHLNKMKNI